jgi:tripartite-type tricarboxylate transporter receptor subunit TctC
MLKIARHFAAFAAFAAAFIPPPTQAADEIAFFNGKTVTYVVPTKPGGGYDYYGRLIAEYMQRHLPGSTFIVRNVPGAGHIIGVNLIFSANPDGLTIGIINQGLIYSQLAGTKGIKFDLAKLSWIGKAAADPRVFVISTKSPIKSFADLKQAKKVNFATCGVGCAAYVETKLLTHVFKLPINLMAGYDGSDDQLAMRRGEIAGTVASRSSTTEFVNNGYARYVAQIGGTDKDVPQLSTFADTGDTKALVALIESQSNLGRMTAGTPAIPAARLEVLRSAYKKSIGDSGLQAMAKKARRPIEPAFGEEVARMVKTALSQSPQTISLLKEALAKKK